jgi:hypothetical protein
MRTSDALRSIIFVPKYLAGNVLVCKIFFEHCRLTNSSLSQITIIYIIKIESRIPGTLLRKLAFFRDLSVFDFVHKSIQK